MRRRRRGSRFTWMPMLGTTYDTGGEGPGYSSNAIRLFLQPETSNATQPNEGGTPLPSLAVTALVPDYTEEPDPNHGTGMTLRDYTEGQDWFLRRIVGKFHISAQALTTDAVQDTQWPAVLVTAGFFVARSKDSTEGVVDLTDDEFDPQGLINIRQPWLWRRTWVLGAAQTQATTGFPQLSALWPNSTEEFGSMADGGHVDAKTLRRIRREQRLWLAVSAFGVGSGPVTSVSGTRESQPEVQIYADLRCLGAMRRSNNKSTF